MILQNRIQFKQEPINYSGTKVCSGLRSEGTEKSNEK